MQEYIQREFKITNENVAALIASGSHRGGPPGGSTPSRGPPRGRGTPAAEGHLVVAEEVHHHLVHPVVVHLAVAVVEAAVTKGVVHVA